MHSRDRRPLPIIDYLNALEVDTFHAWRAEMGWSRNSVDHLLTPSRGMQQRIWMEATLPGSTVEYFKLNYNISKYWPLSRHLVLNTRAELGYGDNYDDSVTRDLCRDAHRRLRARPDDPPERLRPTACPSSRTSTPVACVRCAASATTPWVRARRPL